MSMSESNPDAAVHAALEYHRRGWRVIPLAARSKSPKVKGWPTLVLDEPGIRRQFKGACNVGVVLGDASGGLVDVDLDSDEAVALSATFLPPTGCVFGRASRPASHWVYVADGVPRTARYATGPPGGEREVLLELRAGGCQTLFPPSVHPSGERVKFDTDGPPARVDGMMLARRVAVLAVAVLAARAWPRGSGCRQNVALALAGGLLASGWAAGDVNAVIGAAAAHAGDEDVRGRAKAADYTAQRVESGGTATGWPALDGLLGGGVVKHLRTWAAAAVASGDASAAVTSLRVGVTHETHENQIGIETQREARLPIVCWGALPPHLDGADCPRLDTMLADHAAKRPSGLSVGDYLAAAVEAHWRRRGTLEAEKWTTPMWGFTRDVKGHPDLAGLPVEDAAGVVDAVFAYWSEGEVDPWERWLGADGDDDARMAFVFGWSRVLFLPGHALLDAALEAAQQTPLPIPPDHRHSDGYALFLAVAGWLQVLVGDRNIFLPCRKIGETIGKSHMAVSQYRLAACEHAYLRKVKPGTRGAGGARRADEYRFDLARFDVLAKARTAAGGLGAAGDSASVPAAG